MGHTGARSVRPISQSIGSQVENEQQFMEQRIVYMASFAVFGALGNKSGAIGIADTVDEWAFQGAEMPDGTPANIYVDVTPHQYIYPCGFDGQTTRPTYQRTSPKQTCKVSIASAVVQVSDTSMGLRGVNYYSSLGNLSRVSTKSKLTIKGKRISKFAFNGDTDNGLRPNTIELFCNNVISLNIHTLASRSIEEINLSNMVRLKNVYVIHVKKTILPKTSTLKYLRISGITNSIVLENLPSLSEFYYDSITIDKLHTLIADETIKVNLQSFIEFIYATKPSKLTEISINNIGIFSEGRGWTNIPVEMLDWYADRGATFKGQIGIYEPKANIPSVTWNLKNKFLKAFGNVDDATSDDYHGLLLDYKKMDFDA